MTQRDWEQADAHTLGVFLNGEEIADARRAAASAIVDDSFLLLFNAHHEDVDVHAAGARASAREWALELCTADPRPSRARRARRRALEPFTVVSRSLVVLRCDALT